MHALCFAQESPAGLEAARKVRQACRDSTTAVNPPPHTHTHTHTHSPTHSPTHTHTHTHTYTHAHTYIQTRTHTHTHIHTHTHTHTTHTTHVHTHTHTRTHAHTHTHTHTHTTTKNKKQARGLYGAASAGTCCNPCDHGLEHIMCMFMDCAGCLNGACHRFETKHGIFRKVLFLFCAYHKSAAHNLVFPLGLVQHKCWESSGRGPHACLSHAFPGHRRHFAGYGLRFAR
jgi:hypothetical protein